MLVRGHSHETGRTFSEIGMERELVHSRNKARLGLLRKGVNGSKDLGI